MNIRSFIFISLIVSFTMSAVAGGEPAEKSREGAWKAARIGVYVAEVLAPLLYLTAKGVVFRDLQGYKRDSSGYLVTNESGLIEEYLEGPTIKKGPSFFRGFRKEVMYRLRRPSHKNGDRSEPHWHTDSVTYTFANVSFLGMMAACMGHGLYGLQKELNLDLFKRLRELGARLKPNRWKDLKTGIKRLVEKW